MSNLSRHAQHPIVFPNRLGLCLFGILHLPAGRRTQDLAVLLLSPGVKMRVGPQGLYRRLTDSLLDLGIPVLRFDCYGLGDSEGILHEEQLRDVYNHIEVGRFVDDTIDSMDWMEREHGIRRFILSGLCGGAITGLLAGARDERVAGILGLGITPVLASRAADAAAYMTQGQLAESRKKYIRRLANPKAWFRLLTLQADYGLIWRFLKQPIEARLKKAAPAAQAAGMATPAAPPENDNANPLFPPAFFTMLKRHRPMLYIFGGGDRLRWEFDEKFVQRHQQTLASLPPAYQVHVIGNANHVLSLREWQREMLDVSTQWMRAHFPEDVVQPAVAEHVAVSA